LEPSVLGRESPNGRGSGGVRLVCMQVCLCLRAYQHVYINMWWYVCINMCGETREKAK
jgi:hypothetical protein